MRVVTQLDVTVDNVPGRLSAVCTALLQSSINILGMCASSEGSKQVWHFVVNDIEAAKSALVSKGSAVTTSDVLGFSCAEDKPGIIAAIARTCSDSGINIGNIYCTSAVLGGPTSVYLSVDKKDFVKAKEVCARLQLS